MHILCEIINIIRLISTSILLQTYFCMYVCVLRILEMYSQQISRILFVVTISTIFNCLTVCATHRLSAIWTIISMFYPIVIFCHLFNQSLRTHIYFKILEIPPVNITEVIINTSRFPCGQMTAMWQLTPGLMTAKTLLTATVKQHYFRNLDKYSPLNKVYVPQK